MALNYESVKQAGTSIVPTITLTINSVGTGTPTAVKFYSGSTLINTQSYVEGTNSYSYTMDPISDTTTIKGELEYTKSDTTMGTVEKTTTYTFVSPSYYGAVAASPTDKAGIIALTKNVKKSKVLTATFNLSNQKSCYAYPATFGDLTSIKDSNNLEYLGSYTKTTVEVDGVTYNVYTLTDPVTATGFKQTYIILENNSESGGGTDPSTGGGTSGGNTDPSTGGSESGNTSGDSITLSTTLPTESGEVKYMTLLQLYSCLGDTQTQKHYDPTPGYNTSTYYVYAINDTNGTNDALTNSTLENLSAVSNTWYAQKNKPYNGSNHWYGSNVGGGSHKLFGGPLDHVYYYDFIGYNFCWYWDSNNTSTSSYDAYWGTSQSDDNAKAIVVAVVHI